MPDRAQVARAVAFFCALGFAMDSFVLAEATKPEFTLTKGSGLEVCEAYLERLNATQWQDPPYCDRPEVQQPSPFSTLNRVSLSPSEAAELINRVESFRSDGDQDSFSKMNSSLVASGAKPMEPAVPIESLRSDLSSGRVRVWRYDPLVDIDNDGKPDRVIIWHGAGASIANYPCGETWHGEPFRQVQMGFVMMADAKRIDEQLTRRIFGHPKAGEEHWGKAFMPVGYTIGILQFRGTTYFDTFLASPLGDVRGKRRTRSLQNTLGLFVARNSATEQVCEYKWKPNRTEWR
jgi:hypothetical protein